MSRGRQQIKSIHCLIGHSQHAGLGKRYRNRDLGCATAGSRPFHTNDNRFDSDCQNSSSLTLIRFVTLGLFLRGIVSE